jgi:hypothetical protein
MQCALTTHTHTHIGRERERERETHTHTETHTHRDTDSYLQFQTLSLIWAQALPSALDQLPAQHSTVQVCSTVQYNPVPAL